MTHPYGQNPQQPAGQTPPPAAPAAPGGYGVSTPATGTPVLSIITFVLAAIGLFFLPIVFGLAGIVTGIVAVVRKERLGKIALIVAVAATVLGFVLGAIAFNAVQG
ncbi:hypothetical protein [Cellulomonas pakistanensis]|uniref:DUF4190 domain-containing protein n=1 Tax=Cellulomonas pakistanensis TaxID=992287 RepID=A0A919U6R4_9CELL|nr:hypothetical protein [Cellulomonas pakistanensis]GIG36520.1 hypothetical protein Cpa01nite_19010 [Cellulomonas pakistanensis]